MVLLIGMDVALLVVLRPAPRDLARDVTAPHAWLARTGGDGAAAELAGAALWLCAGWLAIGLLAWLVSTAPGAAGRHGRKFARFVLPGAVYRLAAGAAGVGILFAPTAAGAMSVAPQPGSAATPAPVWPNDSPPPAPVWPTSGARPPSSAPQASTGNRGAGPATARPGAGSVVVRPGDSLWSIAAAQLPASASPARIAAQWPRWFAANRAVIGADPARIVPGQLLHAPAAATHHHVGHRT